jgi:hypothetical protein
LIPAQPVHNVELAELMLYIRCDSFYIPVFVYIGHWIQYKGVLIMRSLSGGINQPHILLSRAPKSIFNALFPS